MSDFETAARPYARALFELASEANQLQQWQDNLQQAAVIAADADMLATFDQPAMLPKQTAELFLSVASAAGIGGAWMSAFTALEPYRPIFIGVTAIFLAAAFSATTGPSVASTIAVSARGRKPMSGASSDDVQTYARPHRRRIAAA